MVASQASQSSRKGRKHIKSTAFPYLMTLPYFLIYALFGLFPIIYTFFLSFYDWNGVAAKAFVGLSNYVRLAGDPVFWTTLLNTLILAVFALPLQLLLGFALAAVLSGKAMPLKKTFRFFNFLPYITNSVAIMEKFRKMPRNYVLIALGGNYDPLLNSFLGSAALREL